MEELVFDLLLSGSSFAVMVLGAGSLVACAKNRMVTVKAQVDMIMNASASSAEVKDVKGAKEKSGGEDGKGKGKA